MDETIKNVVLDNGEIMWKISPLSTPYDESWRVLSARFPIHSIDLKGLIGIDNAEQSSKYNVYVRKGDMFSWNEVMERINRRMNRHPDVLRVTRRSKKESEN